jgi:hypothetical protein
MNVKKIASAAKKFVVANKVELAVATTLAVCVVVHCRIIKEHNDFLKEHDLFDAYYPLED